MGDVEVDYHWLLPELRKLMPEGLREDGTLAGIDDVLLKVPPRTPEFAVGQEPLTAREVIAQTFFDACVDGDLTQDDLADQVLAELQAEALNGRG